MTTTDTFTLITYLPAAALEGVTTVDLNDLDVDIATKYPEGDIHRKMAEERLAAAGVEDLSEWQVIGTRFDDHSGYDEFDGKWEYYSETRLLMVRKVDMVAARERYFSTQGESLTHNPFAAALGR